MTTPKEILLGTLKDLGRDDFEEFKWHLKNGSVEGLPAIPESELENAQRTNIVDLMFDTYSINTFEVAKNLLGRINRNDLLENLNKTIPEPKEILTECQLKLKSDLKQKFQCVLEGISTTGNPTLLKCCEQALRVQWTLDRVPRLLLGLSLQTNQDLLCMLTQTLSSSQTNQETVQYIKKKLSGKLSAEESINLFHCLNELDDRSLVEEIRQSLSSGRLSTDQLSPAQWSALVFILLSSDLDEFDLEEYSRSEKAFLKLLPVVKASKKVLLRDCKLSKRSFEALSEILSSPSNHLRELDLSSNKLQDSGLDLLCVGLKSS
ncbi:uncharacterized protein LOC120723589 [Simochromis diagramma]|uniref:uncharacterized protein LOC120723589 n=1 Tax=Simochromis diagramma TaxID=43689 RepID=UPI001A7EDBCB|nr:uncharacterized protein LOC120723589 [Simochromis diagramma]